MGSIRHTSCHSTSPHQLILNIVTPQDRRQKIENIFIKIIDTLSDGGTTVGHNILVTHTSESVIQAES